MKELQINPLSLRCRLLRRSSYRGIRNVFYFLSRIYIRQIKGLENLSDLTPSIFFCSYTCDYDFLVLPAILRRDLVYLIPGDIQKRGIIGWVLRTNFVLFATESDKPGYRFFREVMRSIKDYNRSLVAYPTAATTYAKGFEEKYIGLIKIAVKANVPIIPIVAKWNGIKRLRFSNPWKCDLEIGKRIYISPNNYEFQDIFFRKRGFRKYSNLSKEDFQEIGNKIISRLRIL